MKRKVFAAIVFIALFGAFFLMAACALREDEADAAAPYAGPELGVHAETALSAPEASDPYAATASPPEASEPSAVTASPPDAAAPYAGPELGIHADTALAAPEASEPYAATSSPPALAASASASDMASPATKVPAPALPAAEDRKEDEEVLIPVLNYHSIGAEPENSLVLDPGKFAAQMEYLSKHGFTPLSISDFTQIMEKRRKAPPKPVLLTFDDGYADNYELAMPVLKRYGFPATLFLSPGLVGQEGYLTWEQVKEMHDAGWDIEPHAVTHPNLPMLSAAKQKEEITGARRQIEEKLGTTADIFCYPYGAYDKRTLAILKETGFRFAFTIKQGWASSAQPPLQLKRIYVNGKESLEAWSRKLEKPY
jgi:peptidoglycan/xylan/chitin deacetylase (PgdA/CDA1 family)